MLSRAAAAQGAWDAIGGEARARLLDRTADLFEAHREEFYSLCIREAGKTLPDAVLEVREAVDFLRYYAAEGRRLAQPVQLPGPTGELNELRHHGRGVWTCISPWNFPLAIFTGPVAAALAAGNSAIAKPAEQTPLIGALAVRLMHEAGIPADVVQLAVGDGKIGAALVSHRADLGRRLHRLDRGRPRDQPQPGGARRPDRPADRRDRRPECDDRRQLGAARAGDPRRRRLGLPVGRPALLGAARAVRPGRRRRHHADDDPRRDGSAVDRRSAASDHRCRPGHRHRRQGLARRSCRRASRRGAGGRRTAAAAQQRQLRRAR